MSGFLPPDPVSGQLERLVRAVEEGRRPSEVETENADVKEERGRRGPAGEIRPGASRNEEAARQLHEELACMANTPGGGGLLVGVADDGSRIGTALDPEWLRHRIFELSQRQLTASVRPHALRDGTRVLLCVVPQAVEPHRVDGRIRWRVGDHCVEVDPSTWHSRTTLASRDWSSEASDLDVGSVGARALEVARELLLEGGSDADTELARAPDRELLRRLPNVLVDGERLSNAARLLFTAVQPALDYRHRATAGGDATIQVRRAGPVLVQLVDVFAALAARRRLTHLPVPESPVVAQHEALPLRSAREAIVNGVVHRDWSDPEPTEVEHVGDRLRVTSPGGLVGTVTPENIITHVSAPRHRALAELTTRLRLTERQGIGVDRMYLDLLRLGRPRPEIVEEPGPRVRTSLLGGDPDADWVLLLAQLRPSALREDLNVLLALDQLADRGWVDATALARRIQDREAVAADALDRLRTATVVGRPLVEEVEGQPDRKHPAVTLTAATRGRLGRRAHRLTSARGRPALVLGYAERYGRISTTEASSLTGVAVNAAGAVLKELEADGELEPSRQNRAGRGFHYRRTGRP